MPKLKHLKDTQCTRNIVWNHQEKLWDKSDHQQNNSRLINREYIVREENIINSDERMFSWQGCILHSKSVSSFHQNDYKSTLKRNQFINKLFINSLINDIGWRNIKEENSWSYAWRFYHKRLMMVQESSITIQDMIWRMEINQRNFDFEKVRMIWRTF